MSSATAFPYATDEDIALRAPADFEDLCPVDQTVAVGDDALFSPGEPWTLRSPSTDFPARGVEPGQVVLLGARTGSGLRAGLGQFVVASVGDGAVTLRRKGLPDGKGEPPKRPDDASAVDFRVLTLAPQVAVASRDLERRFGMEVGGCDPGDLRDAVVLTVLAGRYLDEGRVMATTAAAPSDRFAVKATLVKAELDDLISRITLRRRGSAGDSSTRFSTRMCR